MPTAPTFSSYVQVADWMVKATAARTVVTSWSAGDQIYVIGCTADAATVFTGIPTATGLTFSQVVTVSGGVSTGGTATVWMATAASPGASVTISSSTLSNNTNAAGIAALVVSGSDGVGPFATSEADTARSLSLTRTHDNAAVLFVNTDWNAESPAPTAWTPAGFTQRTATSNAVDYGVEIATWGDQGSAGATTYGQTGAAVTTHTWAKIAIEIQGTGTVTDQNQAGSGPLPWRRWYRIRGMFKSTYDLLSVGAVPPSPGPTIAVFEADWTSTADPKTLNVTGCLTDDWLFVIGGSGHTGTSDITAIDTTTTVGSTTAWSEPQENLNAPQTEAWITSAVAQVTADGDVTVQVDPVKSGTPMWGFTVIRARNSGGLGVSGFVDDSATQVVNLTVSQDSAVFFASFDFDAGAVGTGWTPAADVAEIERSSPGGNYTVHVAYWTGQAAGTRDYGSTGAGGASRKTIALEILAAGVGGDDATVTPATIATTADVPAPTVQTGSTVAPATIATAAALPAPTVNTGATVQPATIATASTVPAPAISTGTNATATPATVATVSGVGAPSLSTGETVPAATVATAAALPAPTVRTGSTVSPATIVTAAAVPAPSISTGASPTPAAIATVAGVGTPALSTGEMVAPATVATAAALPAPTVRTGSTVSPATVATVAALPAPAVTAGGSATVPAVTVATIAAVPAATFSTGQRVNPATVVTVSALPAPTVRTGTTPTPATVVTVVVLPAPSLSTGQRATPATIITIAALPAPSVGAGAGVVAVTIATVAALPTPSVRTGVTIAAQVIATFAQVGVVGVVAAEPPVFTAMFGKPRLVAGFGNPRLTAGFGNPRFEARFSR